MSYLYPSLRTTLPVAGYYARLDAGAAATDQFTVDGSQDGTLTNGATRADDSGVAYSFDGSNDYLTIPAQLIPTGGTARTISFWFKSTATISTRQWLMYGGTEGSYSRFGIEIESSKIALNLFSASIYHTQTLSSNTWYHVAVVVTSATEVILYVNGVGQSFTVASSIVTGVAANTRVGIFANLTSFPFSGLIDDLVVWNSVALDSTHIGYLNAQRGAIYAETPVSQRRRTAQASIRSTF